MSARLLDGRVLAARIKSELRNAVEQIERDGGPLPWVVNIMVGEASAAASYAASQQRIAAQIGVRYTLEEWPAECSQQQLRDRIIELNQNERVTGIMIHKPLPPEWDHTALVDEIHEFKDIEGVHPRNLGRLLLGETALLPCTPSAVMELLDGTGESLRGKEAVVVGTSRNVGLPLSVMLLQKWATVRVCHIATFERGVLSRHLKDAEIVVSATGQPELIKGEWLKEGAVVVDVGFSRTEDGRWVGDVEFDTAKEHTAWITPVPGGVGPVTVVMLFKNVLKAYHLQREARGVRA